jgi:nucleoid-associated protein YgaU
MSAATEFAPVVYIPERARPNRPEATVIALHRPAEASIAPPLRLTRRGVAAVSAAVAILAGLLLWAAALSAPASPAQAPAPAAVTVGAGDTLWSIATSVAPGRDPRAEVVTLQRLNHLTGTGLMPGEVLRTR